MNERPDMSGLRGTFVVLDGPDGAGKTTVRGQLAQRLRARSLTVTECKDPGGTPIGDRIRSVILDHDLDDMDVRCETLLFMASRAQLISECIRPALQAGHVVLCDRFVSSTCAYQVAAGGDFDTIIELARYAIGDAWPDLTVILDVPLNTSRQRLACRAGCPTPSDIKAANFASDSMERRSAAFHEAVRNNFLSLPCKYPSPIRITDATPPLETVIAAVEEELALFASTRKSEKPLPTLVAPAENL